MLQKDSKPILIDDGGILQPAVDSMKDMAKQPGQLRLIISETRRLIDQICHSIGKCGVWYIVHTSVHVVRIVHAQDEKVHARGLVTYVDHLL